MKKIKRILSMALVVVIAFLICAFPASATSEQSINDVLLSRGYPQEILETLCEEAKIDILNSGSVFESVVTVSYDENGNEIEKVNGGIATRGQIKQEHLTLSFVIGTNSDKSKNITFNYQWNYLPINRYQDPIGIAWDNAYFQLRANTFHKVDRYQYCGNDNPNTFYYGTKSDQWAFAAASPTGVTWYADLKGYMLGVTVLSLYGYANFTLDRKVSSGTSQLYAKYAHQKTAGSISLTLGGILNIGVSSTSLYDELGIITNISA